MIAVNNTRSSQGGDELAYQKKRGVLRIEMRNDGYEERREGLTILIS
jgi:hypothetical protein